jgi:Tol biopolymer transport system component
MRFIRNQPIVSLALCLMACGIDGPPVGPEGPDPERPPAFQAILSNPVSRAPGASSPGTDAATKVVYVSMPVGRIGKGLTATITNLDFGTGTSVPVIQGGFDPVALDAEEGDVIRIEVLNTDATSEEAEFAVPPRKHPVVVRTDPAPGTRGVPRNTTPIAVFSEPIDPITLNSLQLLQNGVPVAGTAAVTPAAPWKVTFSAAAPLDAMAEFELAATDQIRDLDGDALEATVRVSFATEPPPYPLVAGIAFVSTRDASSAIPGPGGAHIYVTDNSGVTRLTTGDFPSWSWDGRQVVFTRGPQASILGGAAEIAVIDADGRNERGLSQFGGTPAWSPDGTRIAFQGPANLEKGGIFVMNADGSEVTRLIGYEFGLPDDGYGDGFVGFPSWSPDGRSIAFVRGNYGIPWEVYIMNADGSGVRRLGFPGSVGDSRLWWSPDGTRILLQYPQWWIASVSLDGSSLRNHAHASYVGDPDWSPDGQSVAFTMFSGPPTPASPFGSRMRIFITDTGTGVVRRLIPEAVNPAQPDYWDHHVAWSRVRD